MKFRVTFQPPAEKIDFDGCLAVLRQREHSKKVESADTFRKSLARSQIPRQVVYLLLRSPVFNSLLNRRIQVWKVLKAEWPVIEYSYDTEPVNIKALADFASMMKHFRKSALKDFWFMMEEGHRRMWKLSRKEAELPAKAVKVEVLERTEPAIVPASPGTLPAKP